MVSLICEVLQYYDVFMVQCFVYMFKGVVGNIGVLIFQGMVVDVEKILQSDFVLVGVWLGLFQVSFEELVVDIEVCFGVVEEGLLCLVNVDDGVGGSGDVFLD